MHPLSSKVRPQVGRSKANRVRKGHRILHETSNVKIIIVKRTVYVTCIALASFVRASRMSIPAVVLTLTRGLLLLSMRRLP